MPLTAGLILDDGHHISLLLFSSEHAETHPGKKKQLCFLASKTMVPVRTSTPETASRQGTHRAAPQSAPGRKSKEVLFEQGRCFRGLNGVVKPKALARSFRHNPKARLAETPSAPRGLQLRSSSSRPGLPQAAPHTAHRTQPAGPSELPHESLTPPHRWASLTAIFQ